jgi:hypothetical protein
VGEDGVVTLRRFIRFPGLLDEMGLSAVRTAVLAVKIEADANLLFPFIRVSIHSYASARQASI